MRTYVIIKRLFLRHLPNKQILVLLDFFPGDFFTNCTLFTFNEEDINNTEYRSRENRPMTFCRKLSLPMVLLKKPLRNSKTNDKGRLFSVGRSGTAATQLMGKEVTSTMPSIGLLSPISR